MKKLSKFGVVLNAFLFSFALPPSASASASASASPSAPTPTKDSRSLSNAHRDGVWKIAYSRDGKQLATSGGDGLVRIWNAATLKRVTSFRVGQQDFQVYDAQFLSDGKRVIAAALAGEPQVHDAATGKLLVTLVGHKENVSHVAVSQDGAMLFTAGSDDQVIAWDSESYAMLGSFKIKSPVGLVPLKETGKILVTSLGGVAVVDVVKGVSELSVNPAENYISAAGPIGSSVFIAGQVELGAVPQAVDVESGAVTKTFGDMTGGFIWGMTANASRGAVVVSAYKGLAIGWDIATGKEMYSSAKENWQSLSVAFSPSGKELAIGDDKGDVHFVTMK